jgi:nitrate reductase NapE
MFSDASLVSIKACSVRLARMPNDQSTTVRDTPRQRRVEIYAFLIVTALVMPALAVAVVGTYGLSVWIYQTVAGPPGPPSR